MPDVSCEHRSRELMFHTVIQGAYECFKLWKSVERNAKDWIRPSEDLLDEMNSQPSRLQWIRVISLIFINQRWKCENCYVKKDFDGLSLDGIPFAGRARTKRNLSPSIPQKRRKSSPDQLPLDMAEDKDESLEESTYNRSFINFDDYGSSPLYNQRTPTALDTWTFESSGFLSVPDWSSAWIDRGYRLPPDFHQISSKKEPTDYISRLFPAAINDMKEPLKSGSDTEEDKDMDVDSFFDSRRKPISMSGYSMLDEAGTTPKTKESCNVFVRGKSRGDEFIKLDMEKDHEPLTRGQIAISVDIDSIMWVTRGTEFSCKGAINLHLKPHYSPELPFSANPSVYVGILEPPKDNAELKRPQSRLKTRFPLSSIPHIPFGYFGEATQQFNLYIFFPRMIHKNYNNNRSITIIPHELKELWFSEAVFKALENSMGCYPGTSEYLPRSAEQLRWKAGGHSRQPTFPVSPSAIRSLLANIRSELNSNEDLLSRFGSFFLVLDARGIKTLTKQHNSDVNAFQMLQTVVPSLDWDHMTNRTNGELYLDLGVSFHPINTLEPMVGLWRLSSLKSSYSLMGHSKKVCNKYHHNTMQDYGGMKAETSDSTRHHTHIVKRISYNLHFEAVRQPGQKNYISTLDDAIRCNQKYVEGCQHWVKVLEEGEKHPYGVRDELRASAHVVNMLFPTVIERVWISPFLHIVF